jgi:DNA-binding transcriptional LysR family regulator
MSNPDWSHYRALLAVLRTGSLSGAARELGLTQPTLGRQIGELERHLGAALFIRSPRGITPTDVARDLRPHAEVMARAAEAMARAASGGADETRGVVRVTASDIVGVEVLPPLLASFRRCHPNVKIELDLSNDIEDMLHGAADIAVRMVAPTQEALVARKIGVVGIGLYGHRRYFDGAPRPSRPAEIKGHALIGFDRERPYLRALMKRLPIIREDLTFRADNDLAQLAAIRAGLGIGFIQHAIARRDSDLIAVCPLEVGISLEMWLVLHEDLRASRRMRLMLEHLAAGLSAHVAASQAAGC